MTDLGPTSVLSDGTIRRLVGEGRIKIDPWDESLVQPASVDLRLGDSFRVFHNHRVVGDRPARPAAAPDRGGRGRRRRALRHPPRRVRASGARWSGSSCPTTSSRESRGKSTWPARPDRPRDRRVLRSGLEGDADARARQPHPRADQALPGLADRAALVHDARRARPSGPTGTPSWVATTRARSRPPRAATGSHDRRRPGASPTRLLKRGTPIVSADGVELGTTDRVLENRKEHIFDGIVMRAGGSERFVDAPEVRPHHRGRRHAHHRRRRRRATCPDTSRARPSSRPTSRRGAWRRFFGGGWRRH